MEMDFVDRQRYRSEARNAALDEAAQLLDEAAIRLMGGRARVPQADQHTAAILREKAEAIRALRKP